MQFLNKRIYIITYILTTEYFKFRLLTERFQKTLLRGTNTMSMTSTTEVLNFQIKLLRQQNGKETGHESDNTRIS